MAIEAPDTPGERLRLARERLGVSVDYLLVRRDTPQRDATALYESTQDELVALHILRMRFSPVSSRAW